jgi:hypothetical protein
VAAVVLMPAGLIAQAKPSFAGEWKIVTDPDGGRGQGSPGVDLTITQSATAMTVEYRGGGQETAPVKLIYKLDGSVSKNMVAGRGGGAPTEQVSQAIWDGNKLVGTTTTGAIEEKRTFSIEGGNLVVETSTPARYFGGTNVTKVTYNKYVRGNGG